MKLKQRLDLESPVEFFTEKDPTWFLPIDNRPLYNLNKRDEVLVTYLDNAIKIVDFNGITGNTNEIPVGWSVVRQAEGTYLVVHNLGLTTSSVNILVSVGSFGAALAFVSNQDSMSFVVKILDIETSSLTDSRFVANVTKV